MPTFAAVPSTTRLPTAAATGAARRARASAPSVAAHRATASTARPMAAHAAGHAGTSRRKLGKMSPFCSTAAKRKATKTSAGSARSSPRGAPRSAHAQAPSRSTGTRGDGSVRNVRSPRRAAGVEVPRPHQRGEERVIGPEPRPEREGQPGHGPMPRGVGLRAVPRPPERAQQHHHRRLEALNNGVRSSAQPRLVMPSTASPGLNTMPLPARKLRA